MISRDSFIEDNKAEFEKLFKKLIGLKGVSATGEGINETIKLLQEKLKGLGAHVEVIQTAGSPTILAEIRGQSDRTVLFYGHYDVMTPGIDADWDTDPFTLTKKDGRFYGSGAGDNKGQLLAQILGLYVYKKVNGGFPFNIKFLIEGEEEQGSKNLPFTVKKLSDNKLKDVDLAIVVDGSFNQSGQHVLRLGNRGALGFQITAQTGMQDNHSGNLGNIMRNPVLILMKLLQKMYDFENNKVLIPDFYNGVEEPSKTEINWMKQLPYDKKSISEQTGVSTLPDTGLEYYKKLMFRPTFNISGINAGYTAKGMKSIIPHEAVMKVETRLVGKQDIQEIQIGINNLLQDEINNGDIKVHYLVQVPPCKTASDDKDIGSLVDAIKEATGSGLIEPTMPGTVPNYVWSDILKVPVFTIPYANFDQCNHAPNENITEKAFYDGIKISYELLEHL
ncbi:peptidase M20 [Companilactobacillus tucceti DSM 20183]|uniref:Peptidase M20 n=1 Tax=Companilactobacillus tucceti DSM 20183 TaxID=1423811 RepID=A0A0R1IZS8_9LACO|nr:M20/M25/M40 family metallo-hydrolase [Companilactobacillus tucceti]KRK64813.1 peptidase M20 [Companilactobacillus tucceti DSM 20183]